MIVIRVAENVCIYWETSTTNPDLENVGLTGQCVANKTFEETLISCYNGGQCDGAGTCRDCTAYDVGGLKFSHKDTTQIRTSKYLYVWNAHQNKYLQVNNLKSGETTEPNTFLFSLTRSQAEGALNYSGYQVPMNLLVYNLRAKFQKCCNWAGSPVKYLKNQYGVLYAGVTNGSTYLELPYLPKNAEGEYVLDNSNTIANKCSLGDTTNEWRRPLTVQNPTSYGCNGSKPECPYYTGPKWTYCVDTKMAIGDKISAAQIMELRYYSLDWSSMTNPQAEWTKRFKDPQIWAWSGEFEDRESTDTPTTTDNPMVRLVSINSFNTVEPVITIGAPEAAVQGTIVQLPDGRTVSENYPTLVKELKDVATNISIAWPKSTSSSPFVFKTFRIGQNVIRIFVNTPYTSTVYGSNLTTNSQEGRTDAEHILYMQTNKPDDLLSVEASESDIGLIYFDVDLEYGQNINVIKFYTRDPTSSSEGYLTVECYVDHKMYHGHIAQTAGKDFVGHPNTKTWIDYFERVSFTAEVSRVTGDTHVDEVFWDTHAGTKITMYPIEEIIVDQLQSDWHVMHCNFAAVTFSDTRCNSVMPWKLTGSVRGTNLRVYVDRVDNERATEPGIVELDVYYRASNGAYLPGNVIIIGQKAGVSLSSALDPITDKIYATYAVTEYKQGPVADADVPKLKYPDREQYYIDTMPISIDYNSGTGILEVEGNFIEVSSTAGADAEKIYSLDDVKESVYKNLADAETQAVDSFKSGGLFEDSIDSSAEIYGAAVANFVSRYGEKYFADGSTGVTLGTLCTKLKNLKIDEGDYKFMAVFKDENNRPIGIKRIYMMVQSAIAETRDVEIRYKWEMTARDWVITDQLLLLARFNDPTTAGDPYGSVYYNPHCGDHSELLLGDHIFGDPGPMWYPYDKCNEPAYDVDELSDYVKCKNPVEGFSETYAGKRWAYWERMRGPDRYRTWIAGPILLVGCFYRDVSYTYETVDEQNFAGYTRIRACHPFGPFSKDREALHVNRHFIKRNLKVREEVIQDAEDDNVVQWADDYYQYIYVATDEGTMDVRVGSQLDTAVWVHLNDGVSIVNRTTSEAQHPFSHYLLESVGSYSFNEVFAYDSSNRYSLNEVIQDRDLTRFEVRDPDSQTLLYSPEDPNYFAGSEEYSDIIPVFTTPGTAWAWLERPISPVRYTDVQIAGINLYNPSDSVWKKDRTSASYSDEGRHSLTYTAPVFNETGGITSMPTLQWFGGPERRLNWYTGEWLDSGTVYEPALHATKPNFKFFGQGANNASVLIDSSGYHTYIENITNDGTTYGTTFRGLGVNSKVQTTVLPYSLVDFVEEDSEASKAVDSINTKTVPGRYTEYIFILKGYYYVDKIEITYHFGADKDDNDNQVRNDIPGIQVFGLVTITDDGVNTTNKSYLTASGDYQQSTTQGEEYGLEGTGLSSGGLKEEIYNVNVMCDKVGLSFSPIRSNGRLKIATIKLWYRKPEDRIEPVESYERKVGISTGNTGVPDYRKLLYYYNKTVAEAGATHGYESLLSEDLPSIKLTSKNVKDVILEYEYYDPTGSRFAYKADIRPSNVDIFSEDVDGLLSYPGTINVCTKARTLVAGSHVNDNPQVVAGKNFNSDSTATNEVSSCAINVGNRRLNEDVQDCLYSEAASLLGTNGTVISTFNWFWHPDELAFWVDIVGADLTDISPTLTLTSTVSPMYKLFQHEDFACSSENSVPFYDGRIHPIPKWQAIGHWLYAGNPAYNHACADVVIFKIGKHLEAAYETYDYGSNKAGPTWPYETYKDAAFYLEAGRVEKRGTYLGGRLGGVGPEFWAQQSELSHGFTLPQQIDDWEMQEAVHGGRESSTRADASRNGFHSDGPDVERTN